MSIANDISEVLDELGSPVEVHPPGPLVADPVIEKLDKTDHIDQMTLFPRMYQAGGTLATSTSAVAGSMIKHGNLYYLVTCLLYTEFEGEPIEANVVMYLCNALGSFSRYSDSPVYDGNYHRVEPWSSIVDDIRICFVDKSLMSLTEVHKQKMLEQTYRYVCYIADVFDIKVGDRLTMPTGGKYRVTNLDRFLFPNVLVLGLAEDER